MALVPRAHLGNYEITAPIGEGGMGVVDRARDTRLGRDIALKVLPESFSDDPDRVARFTREAQVLASLDHPNIATIYGLERVGTNQVIVMEMVEGATLEARLAHGPLAIDEARHVGIWIADALDAAHEPGRPSNGMHRIRADGSGQPQQAHHNKRPEMHIRPERPEDIPGIRQVNQTAFDTAAEADLVDALRQQADPIVSLVAVDGEAIVGHILFSPMTLSSDADPQIMGLAPMAVLPSRQRQGIGSALVRTGLDECRRFGFGAIVVLGHADYYPRFGFVPASTFGLTSEYDVPDDVFLALELRPDALRGRAGRIRYHPAFAVA